MNSQHTPGPWEAILHEDRGTVASHPIRADGKSIAAVWCRFGKYRVNAESLREGRANARLMGAALDLRDSIDPNTLEAIADEIDCFEHSARAAGLRSLAKRQRAALAKANGCAE